MLLQCGSRILDLSTPVVMGVLNVTPDSFSDGGHFIDPSRAIDHAAEMLAEGAAVIDVGGESTRPGAAEVSVAEELQRVVPVIEAIRARHDVLVSIDTSKPAVMSAAVAAGAGLINDIRALNEPGALAAAAASGAAICLMHMQGQPADMQLAPHYDDVLAEVIAFLRERVQSCTQAGVATNRLLIDPGIGFGKSLEHNLALLAHLPKLASLQLPLLMGVSRKRLIGTLTGRPVGERLHGGLALATASVLAGAHIIRTHDVAATVDAVRVAHALRQAGYVAGYSAN
ncbi:MAG: dihydropteroate synthase [Steroidobacteraceae bacterium]